MNDAGGAATGLALFAGEAVWTSGEARISSVERLTAFTGLGALVAVATSLWLMASARDPEPRGLVLAAPIIGTLAVAALATRPARILLSPERRDAGLWPSVVWRAATAIVLTAALVVNAPKWGAVVGIPLGIVVGAEAVLGAWAIGYLVDAASWYHSTLTSSLHLGALGAALAGLVRLGWDDGHRAALVYYVAFHLVVITACITADALDHVREHQLDDDRRQIEAIIATEHRSRAHWLHDDVSSHLRIVSLKVQNGHASPDEVVSMLDQLDHTIRLRQLDEVLDSGTARLAEIIQPYVRVAESHGTTIVAVPSFDDASFIVGARAGRLVARATAVLTTNALQAGATEIGYEITHDDGTITISVSDDAGGFDLADVPAGRGLWELDRELGAGRLETTRQDRGTVVTATIPLEVETNGDPAAH